MSVSWKLWTLVESYYVFSEQLVSFQIVLFSVENSVLKQMESFISYSNKKVLKTWPTSSITTVYTSSSYSKHEDKNCISIAWFWLRFINYTICNQKALQNAADIIELENLLFPNLKHKSKLVIVINNWFLNLINFMILFCCSWVYHRRFTNVKPWHGWNILYYFESWKKKLLSQNYFYLFWKSLGRKIFKYN